MAKNKFGIGQVKAEYKFPSHFGSHTSMVNAEETGKLEDQKMVVLEDEFGLYTTERNRLDTGLSDPNRYVESRLKSMFVKKKEDAVK